jgi:hypothetical protein
MRLHLLTVTLMVLCAVSVFLAWADPWADRTGSAPLVSTRSAARRVFPELADRELGRATIELQGQDGPPVRLLPTAEGEHQVVHGDKLLGPADPEAIDGVWASLRMATTLRAVPKGTDVGAGQHGAIRITFADETLSLAMGHDAPAGNGLYGVMEHEGTEAWVVENDLRWLIEQSPEAWLSRRLVLAEPDEVVGLTWGEQLGLKRGDDSLWRVQTGSEPALLSADAVDLRIERLFSSRLEPLIERDAAQAESLRPWLAVATVDGGVHTLAVGGACPGDPDKRLLDRGPGLLGCVPSELTEAWNVGEADSGLLESRLIPYAYGTVLSIELGEPATQSLRRRTGGWLLIDQKGEHAVSEAEVYRWYASRTALEVEQAEAPERFEPDVTLVFGNDGGQKLRVRCDAAQWCARDDGPPRRVLGDQNLALAFDAESFADRGLTNARPGEARALEISDAGGDNVVRQSVHLDLGVWRLDAPEHPDGDAALDGVRLEGLLSALSGLRAEGWVEAAGTPLRKFRLELSPKEGRENTIEATLYTDCIVEVDGRLARVSAGVCEVLGDDLLFDDPLRAWLRTARSLELARNDEELLVKRQNDKWVADTEVPGLEELLGDWEAWRTGGLRPGPPNNPVVEHTLTVRRNDAPTVTVELGDEFVMVRGSDWYYARR